MNSKKLVVFDLDDTLISSNSWLEFNKLLGISEARDYELYCQFMDGTLTYDEWQETLLHEYRADCTKEEIIATLRNYTVQPGARESVQACNELGLQTAIISGGFTIAAEQVASDLGIQIVRANTECVFKSHTDGHEYFEYFISGGDETAAKVRLLQEVCAELSIQPDDCIAVGDGANDIGLFHATGFGITFSAAKPEPQAAASYVIDTLADLPSLLQEHVIIN